METIHFIYSPDLQSGLSFPYSNHCVCVCVCISVCVYYVCINVCVSLTFPDKSPPGILHFPFIPTTVIRNTHTTLTSLVEEDPVSVLFGLVCFFVCCFFRVV